MNTHKPRILLSGNSAPQNFERYWLDWLQDHEYPVQAFDSLATIHKYVPNSLAQRVLWRFFQPVLAFVASRQFVRAARSFQPDLIIVVSGNLITATALQAIRRSTRSALFHYYGEDFFNPLNTKDTLRRSIYFYDHLFTTKTFNISELTRIGLKHISYIPCGYIPSSHYPVKISEVEGRKYGSDLAFVGTWEAERASTLSELREFDLRIWGGYWHKANKALGLSSCIQYRPVYCEEMSRVFNSSKINLAFLRKANRDRHTQRTFEIPACGGFQLAERTDEVLGFFEEGSEIECFDSVAELKDKARYYIGHETQRKRIAADGMARIQRSPYSYADHIQTILKQYAGACAAERRSS